MEKVVAPETRAFFPTSARVLAVIGLVCAFAGLIGVGAAWVSASPVLLPFALLLILIGSVSLLGAGAVGHRFILSRPRV